MKRLLLVPLLALQLNAASYTIMSLVSSNEVHTVVSNRVGTMIADGGGAWDSYTNITIEGNLDVYGTMTVGAVVDTNALGAYGEMWSYDAAGSTNITITALGTYYPWTNANVGALSATTVYFDDAGTNATLIPGALGEGPYTVEGHFSFGGTGGAIIQGAIHTNGVLCENMSFTRTLGVGGDIGSASLGGFVSLVETDRVDMCFTSDDNGDTVSIVKFNLLMHRHD